jgi:hypothetical protein
MTTHSHITDPRIQRQAQILQGLSRLADLDKHFGFAEEWPPDVRDLYDAVERTMDEHEQRHPNFWDNFWNEVYSKEQGQ